MASSDLYLSPDQKDLLLAALNSNNSTYKNQGSPPPPFTAESLLNHRRTSSQNYVSQQPDFTSFGVENDDSFMSNGSSNVNNGDTSLGDLDYELDFDISGDNYNYADGEDGEKTGENEKRKHSVDEDGEGSVIDPHEAEPKRREGEEPKQAKKPGRKPLTSEPTTKRKAQNRAAQRAFRERKEKHLRDLEQKVIDLQKESETTTHENKRLKDQVDRLQTELSEYRKRLSLGGANRSPSGSFSNGNTSINKRLSGGNGIGGFSFDFPLFGQVGPHIHNGALPVAPRQNSNGGNLGIKVGPGGLLMMDRRQRNSTVSPTNSNSSKSERSASAPNQNTSESPIQVNKVTVSEPKFKNDLGDLSDLFSPSVLATVNKNNDSDYLTKGSPIQTISSIQSTPQLMDFATSPSASSVSQASTRANNNNNNGPSSSCATSPESMNGNSPMAGKFESLGSISEDNSDKFKLSRQLAKACGNSKDPIPKADASLDWLSQQNGGSFEPVIFDDYRDPLEQINSGIGLSFFDDAFANSVDFNLPASPAPETLNPAPKKFKVPGFGDDDDDDEEVVPADDPKTMLNCNKIWDRISHHPAYQSGDLDMDGLCSQLRAKAKCSETGVVVGEKDVEAALKILGEKRS